MQVNESYRPVVLVVMLVVFVALVLGALLIRR